MLSKTKNPTSQQTIYLAAIVIIGIFLRVWGATLYVEPESDFQRYFAVASEFSATGSFSFRGEPFIFQPPAYPFFLGIMFDVFSSSVKVGIISNMVLSIASLLVMLKTLQRIGPPSWVSVVLLAVFATYPGFIAFVPILGSETLSVFLVCLALLLGTYKGTLASVMLGAVLAALALTRPQYLPAVAIIGLVALWRREFSAAIIMAVSFSLVIAPWIIRNQIAFGIPVLVSANGGYVAFVNNNSSNSTATWMGLSQIKLTEEQRNRFAGAGAHDIFEPGDESEKTFRWTPAIDQVATSEAIQWMREHPTQFIKLALKRVSNTLMNSGNSIMVWLAPSDSTTTRLIIRITTLITIAVVALAFVAFSLTLRRLGEPSLILALSIFGLTLAGIAIFEGQGRYLIPMMPAMMVGIFYMLNLKQRVVKT
ncbi:hypothetical protein [Achromobacter sp. NCFB-sbj8-Ac1-l]|uniref:hypothetical protein n=1 Tax=unclassified Achromobacter TaxID=2626865 RepID=UPI004046B9CB